MLEITCEQVDDRGGWTCDSMSMAAAQAMSVGGQTALCLGYLAYGTATVARRRREEGSRPRRMRCTGKCRQVTIWW